eukprot:3569830-Pyramimonas_sp.AAC.1
MQRNDVRGTATQCKAVRTISDGFREEHGAAGQCRATYGAACGATRGSAHGSTHDADPGAACGATCGTMELSGRSAWRKLRRTLQHPQ